MECAYRTSDKNMFEIEENGELERPMGFPSFDPHEISW